MRWRTAGLAVALWCVAACSDEPQPATPTGIPGSWYQAVDAAVADQPDVGAVALMDSGGPCALRDAIDVDGQHVTDILGHGVVRLGGDVPAVSCEWYEGTPVQVTVAQAADDAGYRTLVEGAAAVEQTGNIQTQTDIDIGARTVHVVRTEYPTNPAAGVDFEAFYLDAPAKGRVSLRVSGSDERSATFDEKAAATDLVRFIDGA